MALGASRRAPFPSVVALGPFLGNLSGSGGLLETVQFTICCIWEQSSYVFRLHEVFARELLLFGVGGLLAGAVPKVRDFGTLLGKFSWRWGLPGGRCSQVLRLWNPSWEADVALGPPGGRRSRAFWFWDPSWEICMAVGASWRQCSLQFVALWSNTQTFFA